MRIANWYENCKLIWKLQTHMKIANVHVGTMHRNMRIANWYENCKLIWKLQTDMRAKENCHCAFFCSCTVCFAIVPCILQLCFLFSRSAKTMYYSYVQFCWCANEMAVVLCILHLYIQFVSCELFLQLYNIFLCLLWELQSNSHILVFSSYMDICNFHMRHSGNENLF